MPITRQEIRIFNTRITLAPLLATASFILLTATANAACIRPANAPAVPDGMTAGESDMKTARGAVQGYVNGLEAYQSCLLKQIAAIPPGPDDTQLKLAWAAQADAAIDGAQAIAGRFAAALKAYKERTAPAH